ncbi:hypothetical protein ALC62_01321 [Cyphomyrmex costatus]|uniref:Uncharacterized protein n=1 Tax=Cyphomyrmex costatus TaxID=456900 RepID=A0A195D4I1_9HYME|nr:hypothetical protein ALC62_01321 [Cyphomyrmex costatus]
MSERSLQSRKAMMQQMDEPVRFIRLERSKKRDKTNTAANPVIKVCKFREPDRSQLKLVLYEDEPTALIPSRLKMNYASDGAARKLW